MVVGPSPMLAGTISTAMKWAGEAGLFSRMYGSRPLS